MSCFGTVGCQDLERAKYIFSRPKAFPLGDINRARKALDEGIMSVQIFTVQHETRANNLPGIFTQSN